MSNATMKITVSLCALAVGVHVVDAGTFKDAPVRAAVPLTAGSTLSGPTGPSGGHIGPIVGPPVLFNAVTDDVIVTGAVGLTAPKDVDPARF